MNILIQVSHSSQDMISCYFRMHRYLKGYAFRIDASFIIPLFFVTITYLNNITVIFAGKDT